MKRIRIAVELVIEAPSALVSERALESVLDAGTLQDAIADYECDEGACRVTSCVIGQVRATSWPEERRG